MKRAFPTYILVFFLTFPVFVSAAAQKPPARNPLLDIIGKPYAEYYEVGERIMDSLFLDSPESRAVLVGLYAEAAQADKTGILEIESRRMEIHVDFYNSREGGFIPSSRYTADEFVSDLQMLLSLTQKEELRFTRIRLLFDIAETYRIFLNDYERAFAWYLKMATEQDNVATKEFPLRPYAYRRLGDLYYMFREYADAMTYYEKVINDTAAWDIENRHREQYSAMNNMGLCYRDGDEDYARADSCFRQVLRWAVEEGGHHKWVWEGVAEGNTGYNYYLYGDWDNALRWLVSSVDKIENPGDFPFASARAVNVADIYLKKNNPAAAKQYIDIALDRHEKSGIPEKRSNLYDILLRYYTHTGDRHKATLYLDSMLMAKEREINAFGGLALRRVEQQLRAADSRLHRQELDAEQETSRMYKRVAYLIAAALAIIIVLLGFISFFYNRKRNAYRELVRKSQQWAGIEVSEEPALPEDNGQSENQTIPDITEENTIAPKTATPEESDWVVMESIEKAMAEKQLYKRPELSLDMLAAETGLNRYYISTALNRCTGKNIRSYVNEYRIKEAIRIMSDPGNKNMTIDAVAFEAGFNDRYNFHHVFKKKTGLSPTDFRKNMNGN